MTASCLTRAAAAIRCFASACSRNARIAGEVRTQTTPTATHAAENSMRRPYLAFVFVALGFQALVLMNNAPERGQVAAENAAAFSPSRSVELSSLVASLIGTTPMSNFPDCLHARSS